MFSAEHALTLLMPCILVRSADRTGRSLMAIRNRSPRPGAWRAEVGRICRSYGYNGLNPGFSGASPDLPGGDLPVGLQGERIFPRKLR